MRRTILLALAVMATPLVAAHAQTSTATNTQVFVTTQPTDVLSYNVIGLKITNDEKTDIGEIKDLVLSNDTLAGYIVSVGGFLGMGERYVVVNPKAVRISYMENDRKWTATMNATKEELKAAPEFKYEGRWKR
jgi:hypothetical protein